MDLSLNRKKCRLALLLPLILAGFFLAPRAGAQSDPFPMYPCIQPNVSFWTKIYTEYASNQGVLHDKNNLTIIYGVIELADPDLPAGRRINKARINQAKNKYKAILSKLMRGEPPVAPQEEQVARLFGSGAKLADFREAMHNIRCQVGQKDRFRDGIIRSGAYLDDIKRIFRDYGLPEDLVYLPHVESSFDTKAYSKFGAAGIWQFTRSTGRLFLRIDYTIDERRDPILSSHAAAQLLRQNYQKIAAWPMAISAYNHGVNGMLQAQRSHGGYENIFKRYRSRTFKFASRNFYAEFLAAREVAKNYRQYYDNLELDTPCQSREVELAGYVSLPDIAHHLAIDPEELHQLNPALRSPVVLGQKYIPKGYRLRLPDKSDDAWNRLVAELPQKFYKRDQKHSRIYTVRPGDTAGEIARIHNVRLADLIAANNLGSRATIYIDQNLRIPLPDLGPIQIARLEAIEPVHATTLLLPHQPIPPRYPPEKVAVASAVTPQAPENGTAESESAPLLASIESLDAEENTGSATLRVENTAESIEKEPLPPFTPAESGEPKPSGASESDQFELESTSVTDLVEATDAVGNPPPVSPALMNPDIIQGHFAVERAWIRNGRAVGIIRVEVEETLGHYAEWLEVSARDIRQLNGLRYGTTLLLNQKIQIPLHRVNQEEFEEKRFEYHKELAEDFFFSYRIETVRTYSIKKGDNIWALSREKFEVPLWLIKRYNSDVDFSALLPSQQLLIPLVEKINAGQDT